MPTIVLDAILMAATLLLFYIFDRFTVGCEKI